MQTAVEWLKKELEDYGSSSHLNLDWETFDELCKQANEIQKNQILNDYRKGIQEGVARNMSTSLFIKKTEQQLYNETYGSKGSKGSDEMSFTCKDEDCKHCAEDIAQIQDDEIDYIIKNDTSVMLVCEDCGMEECQCELETLAEKEYPYDELVYTEIKGFIVSAERSAWIEGVKYGQIIRPTSGKYASGGYMVKHFTKKKHLKNPPIRYIMFKCKQWMPFREQLKKKQ